MDANRVEAIFTVDLLEEEVTVLGTVLVTMIEDVVVDFFDLVEEVGRGVGRDGDIFREELARSDVSSEVSLDKVGHFAVGLVKVVHVVDEGSALGEVVH